MSSRKKISIVFVIISYIMEFKIVFYVKILNFECVEVTNVERYS